MKLFVAAILLTLAAFSPAFCAPDGKAIYEKRCALCHGEGGEGDGAASAFVEPPPRDFTFGLFKWKSTPYNDPNPSDADLWRSVAGVDHGVGLNGTSMPGWKGALNDEEINAVIDYIKAFSGAKTPAVDDVLKAGLKGSLDIERGKKLFEDRCSECHGKKGRGDATKRLKDDWGARTLPRDLTKSWTFRFGSSLEDVYRRITVGIPGTQMPSFADPASKKILSDDERQDVSAYVASLDEPQRRPGDSMISAIKVDMAPSFYNDPAWQRAEYSTYRVFPQMIGGEVDKRLYTASLDAVSVKAIYDDKHIALLVEWDDPTKSVPGDAKAAELAGMEVFEDSLAIQWPTGAVQASGKKPYFGMGDKALSVDIWRWKGDASNSISELKANGYSKIAEKEPTFSADATYADGRWSVVVRRPLDAGANNVRLIGQKTIPVAFALWDGSNSDKGARHVLTGWRWISFDEGGGAPYKRLVWPFVFAGMTLAFVLILFKSRKT